MSRQARDWVFDNTNDCTPNEKLIALFIADRAQERNGHSCTLSIDTIMAYTNIGERTVQGALKKLAKCHLHVVEGKGRGNHSVFSFPQIVKGADVAPFTEEKGAIDAPCEAEKAQSVQLKGADCDMLSIYVPLLTVEEEDDDLAAPLRSDLARIVGRTLTSEERTVVDDNAITPYERKRMIKALNRLSARWPTIEAKHNVAKWLQQTFANTVDEREEVAHRRRKYVPDDPRMAFDKYGAPLDAPLDELRLEHAIDPEPLPPLAPVGPVDVSDGAWDKVKAELQLQLAPATFEAFLRNTSAVAWDDQRVVVATRNSFARDWLDQRSRGVVTRAMRSIHGHKGEIVFEVAS